MTSQLIITLAILAFMIVMFVWQKFPMGVTTMTCCALLAAFGILSPSEAFGGFTNNKYHSGRSHDGAEFCHHQDQHRSLYP